MKIDRKALFALAVGWFVLLDILLRTTDGMIGYVNNVSSNVRGLIYSLRFPDIFFYLSVIGLVSLVLLSLLGLAYIWRAWTSVISLTRVLVSFFFFNKKSNSEDEAMFDPEMLEALFKGNNALLWRALSSLLAIWIILILISIIFGLINFIIRPY